MEGNFFTKEIYKKDDIKGIKVLMEHNKDINKEYRKMIFKLVFINKDNKNIEMSVI